MGEVVDTGTLKVGGATLHPSHKVAHFGNAQHRLVFFADCGDATAGAFSPLLAVPCRNEVSETRQRQLACMLPKGLWPTGEMQTSQWRADVSSIIGFPPRGTERCRIVAAHKGVHDCVQAIPPEAGDEDTLEVVSAVAGESKAE